MISAALYPELLAALAELEQPRKTIDAADGETLVEIADGEKLVEIDTRSRVFISYVREDSSTVDHLIADLRCAGLNPWLDRKDVPGGRRWKAAIRDAIREGSGAIVCFSTNYGSRSKTYMNEELTLIIAELRLRPTEKSWFIPVRLDDCAIPDRAIGGGETLRDLQQIDMFENWDEGVQRIVTALRNP